MPDSGWNRRDFYLPNVSTRALGWAALTSSSGKALLRLVCALMARRLERMHGPPAAISAREIVGLWRVDAYSSVAMNDTEWTLSDGSVIKPDSSVLEMHLNGPRLQATLAEGEPWREAIEREFRSISPRLAGRTEPAIVGSTILARQVESFGAETRPAPDTAYATLDAFYRRLILAAFHPGGARRVLAENQGVVDAAISLAAFRARYPAINSAPSLRHGDREHSAR